MHVVAVGVVAVPISIGLASRWVHCCCVCVCVLTSKLVHCCCLCVLMPIVRIPAEIPEATSQSMQRLHHLCKLFILLFYTQVF